MAKIEFYYHPVSEPCRALQMFMDANNIPYEPKFIDLMKGEHLTEDYVKNINPAHTVPAIRHDEFTMFESVAILKYLIATFSTPDHWYPSDLQKRALINQYLCWHHMNTRMKGGLLVMLKFAFEPMFMKKEVSEEERKNSITALKETLDAFDRFFLKDQKFIGGDEISIADLMAIGELIAVDAIGIYVGKDRPKIAAWHKRVKEALGSHYDIAHKGLYEFGDQIKPAMPPIDF